MPRTKVKSTIRNTDQATNAIRNIGELQIRAEKLKGEYELEINKLKAGLEHETKPLLAQLEAIEQQLKLFAFDLYELKPFKTEDLIFGEISIHKGKPTIVLLDGIDTEEAVKRLRGSAKYQGCIKIKYSLDKPLIKKEIPANVLHRYGLASQQKEEFGYKIFREKIEATKSLDSGGEKARRMA